MSPAPCWIPWSAPTTARCRGGVCVTSVFLPGVLEYIQEMREILYDLQTRVQKAKLNRENIVQLMEVAVAGALGASSREGSCRDLPPQALWGSPLVSSLQECSAAPLFGRKDNKETALLDLEGKANALTKRCAALRDAGVKIQEMVEVRHIPERCGRPCFNRERVRRGVLRRSEPRGGLKPGGTAVVPAEAPGEDP